MRGINNAKNPEAVVEAVAKADLVTTPSDQISYHSLRNLSQKVEQRRVSGNTTPVDVLACENMIGGSQILIRRSQKNT